MLRVNTRQSFYAKVDRKGPDECWPWTARRTDKGYGQFCIGQKKYRAHRIALVFSGISVPQNSVVMHSCDNPPCCNPAHLSVGTKADNNRDMRLKGRDRQLFGPANHNTKLTPEAKAAIIARRGEPLGPIAADFGVTKSTICRVQRAAL